MSIVKINNTTYGLNDSDIGIIATGTLRQMQNLMNFIMVCGTEDACSGAALWNS